MIDFIKIYTNQKEELENNLIDMFTDLKCTLDYTTGVALYPCRKYIHNIEIRLTNKSGIIRNSLHKFYNIDTFGLDNNYTDFNYNDIILSIDKLTNYLETPIDKYKITNLEFGLNVEISQPPKTVLNNNTPMFNFDEFNQKDTFGNKGFYKQYNRKQYYIKMYDKGLQYKLDKNLMRIEVKIIDSDLLKKLNINTLSDIRKKSSLHKLFYFLLEHFEKVNMIDTISTLNITSEDLSFIEIGKSPSYWREIREKKSKTEYYKQRNKYNSILEKYNLTTLKNEIIDLLNEKFNQLINPFY